ncbi:DUF4198 domain-containing protein [Paenibacillus alkalitolerans]|uniref:DUF4198 domain-containing protein n=1 Tax=Paenibacillus alkalitolerans TaxID=2799335 RepID=UPI0018F3EE01|nr:DUF4198 domain-containing protein [Paenibacillus alkalitolerans]
MRKTFLSIIVSAFLLMFAVPAWAHDGWSQTNAPIAPAGEVTYVELMLGNHSNHHASYRIDGKWSPETTKVYVMTPAGKKADITGTLFYTGEVTETDSPEMNNYYVASFSSSTPGAYIVSVEGDSIFKHGDVASRTLRSAKSFVAVADIPVMQRVSNLKGFSKPASSDRAEWIPQFNPAAVKPNQTVSVQLLLKGKPLADTEAALIRRSTSDSQSLKTDANGVVTFAAGPADYYLLRAKPATDEKEEGKYDKTNYEATMTFIVQNGSVSLKAETVNPLPVVHVGGKEVEANGLALSGGTLLADAEFIRSHVNPNYEGSGSVGVRQAAEQSGFAVEYFPAVGGQRPAVYIYTK